MRVVFLPEALAGTHGFKKKKSWVLRNRIRAMSRCAPQKVGSSGELEKYRFFVELGKNICEEG